MGKKDDRQSGRMIVNLEYWGNVLSFSNCFTNACVILYINRKNNK